MAKEFCTKKTCTYRTQVSEDKAFCMLPNCPYDSTVTVAKNKPKSAAEDIIQHYKNIGLIP